LAQLFPKWTNHLPTIGAAAAAFLGVAVVAFVWYYFSPSYTDVGYRPEQPIDYSHKLHAGDLGIDCRYCHNNVEVSPHANVPPTQTCMNCHKLIATESQKLLPIRESWANDIPIGWIRAHKVADYAYFNHRAHLEAGIGCADCHGNIAQMKIVKQAEPLSMSWCLDCHRHPDNFLRPRDQLTNMEWTPPENQTEFAEQVKREKKIDPPTDCSGCHR
jgi:hypothetical protein